MPVDPAIAGEHLAAGGGGQQPGQARPQDITPDQLKQSQAQHAADLLTAGPRLPAACRPARAGAASPGGHRADPGGIPAFLPGLPRIQFEPVQHLQQRQLPPVLGLGVADQERWLEHPVRYGEPVMTGRRPGRRDGPGRALAHERQRLGA